MKKELIKEIEELNEDMKMYHEFMVKAGNDMFLRGVYMDKLESARIKKEEKQLKLDILK